jgi:membrane fusion protein, multidrug efflux system
VRTAKESINARVAGRVVEIAVRDNQRVKQGQLPVQIDPQPYRMAVVQAEVRRDGAGLQVDELRTACRQQLAELSASDSMDFGGREFARRKALVTDDWAPHDVFDRADTDLRVADNTLHIKNNRLPTSLPHHPR